MMCFLFLFVFQAVRRDNKQRFGLVEENGELLIRANQGHSVTVIFTLLTFNYCILHL